MKEEKRKLLLKYAATLGVFTFLYPILLILKEILFGRIESTDSVIFYGAMIFSGLTLTEIIVRGKKSIVRGIVAYSLLLLPIFSSLFLFSNRGFWRSLFEIVIAVLLYFIGIRCSYSLFGSILSRGTIVAAGICLTFSLFATFYLQKFEYLFETILTCTYIFIFVALIVKTHQNLDKVFIRRHIESSSVPKNIRNFNTGLILLLFAVTAALVNIRGVLSALSTGMKKMLIGILWLIFKVISLIFGSSNNESTGPRQQEDITPNLPFSDEPVKDNIITNIVVGAIMVGIVIIILYTLYPRLPYIAAAISEKVRSLIEAVKNFIRNLLNLPPAELEFTEDYRDETEKLEYVKQKKRKQKKSMRILKKNLKKITDPAEKVRSIYQMVLLMLKTKGVEISKADTTREIYQKSMSVQGLNSHMEELTGVYEKVRYGERTPLDEEAQLAEHIYSEVNGILKS